MEIPEYNRHRIRAQLIKIVAHLREARIQVNLCEDHQKIVRNASKLDGIATLQLDTAALCDRVESLSDTINKTISDIVSQADVLRGAMDNPHNSTPPITGRFLALEKLTARQRQMVRAGEMPYSDIPTHHTVIDSTYQNKPPKPRKLPPPPPPKPKRPPKRSDMPI